MTSSIVDGKCMGLSLPLRGLTTLGRGIDLGVHVFIDARKVAHGVAALFCPAGERSVASIIAFLHLQPPAGFSLSLRGLMKGPLYRSLMALSCAFTISPARWGPIPLEHMAICTRHCQAVFHRHSRCRVCRQPTSRHCVLCGLCPGSLLSA